MRKKLATTALLLLTSINVHATTIQTTIPKNVIFNIEPLSYSEKVFPRKHYAVKLSYLPNPFYDANDTSLEPTLKTAQLYMPYIEVHIINYDPVSHAYEAEIALKPSIYIFKRSELDGDHGKKIAANVLFSNTRSNTMTIHGTMAKDKSILPVRLQSHDYALSEKDISLLRDISITIETT